MSKTAILDELRPRTRGGSYAEQIRFVNDRLGHDWRYAIDDTLATGELGFRRGHELGSGLRATVQWYLDNERWREAVLREKGAKTAGGKA